MSKEELSMPSGLFIEEVATRTGLTARTLRYWEEKGLLAPSARTEGGMRLYSEADVARVHRIRDFKEMLGLSLDVIRPIMMAEDEIALLLVQASQHEPEGRLPYLRQGVTILAEQVWGMTARIEQIQSMRQGYIVRLDTLREKVRNLEELEGTK
jgi:DNA-binding transcriptional MerR regulator